MLAEDIVPETRDRLAQRVQREGLDNVAVKLGRPADPMLPGGSFDRIFLVHMYHEVTEPYEFLWNLRDGLKPDGLVVVVDSDRPVKRHGMPPRQLLCEFAALGLTPARTARLPHADAYFVAFRISAPRPQPAAIKPCPKQALEQAHPPHAGAVAAGEDQMVEDGDVQRLGRAGQLARGPAVGLARPGIAAWMVVGEDHAPRCHSGRHRR